MTAEAKAAAEQTAAVPPRVWETIAGHEAQLRRLTRLLAEGRTPHALLFFGPEGVGKRRTASAAAASLLCMRPPAGRPCGVCESCRALAAGTHPDFYVLRPEAAGRAARSIRIDAVRAVRAETARVPLLAPRRVVIIDEAESMNEAAQNALLKTLEEPAGAAVFILVTGARQALLPTILSRCTGVSFAPLGRAALLRVLAAGGVPERAAAALAALSEGSAGRALRLYGTDAPALREDALAALEALAAGMTADEAFARGQALGAMERARVLEWLRCARLLLRDVLAMFAGGAPLNADLGARLLALARAMPEARAAFAEREAAETARRVRTSNASPRLAAERFFLRAARGFDG